MEDSTLTIRKSHQISRKSGAVAGIPDMAQFHGVMT
jgi:hypothetical protein